MKWKLGFLVGCAALIAVASTTAVSGRETLWICCESSTDCPGIQLCCAPEPLGTGPCDLELTGFCMEKCVRVGTFTPDSR